MEGILESQAGLENGQRRHKRQARKSVKKAKNKKRQLRFLKINSVILKKFEDHL